MRKVPGYNESKNGKKTALGPGTCLHREIRRWTGEGPTRKCGCTDKIAYLNKIGPAQCRKEIDTIVGWLRDEGIKRGWWQVKLPGARWAIKRLILSAIAKSEKAGYNASGSEVVAPKPL